MEGYLKDDFEVLSFKFKRGSEIEPQSKRITNFSPHSDSFRKIVQKTSAGRMISHLDVLNEFCRG